jgi:hypothetical protein
MHALISNEAITSHGPNFDKAHGVEHGSKFDKPTTLGFILHIIINCA